MFFFVVFDIVVYLEEKDLFDCDVFDWIVLFEVVFDVWLVMQDYCCLLVDVYCVQWGVFFVWMCVY